MAALCIFPDCGREVRAKGMCSGHCNHYYRGEPLVPLANKKTIHRRDKAVALIHKGLTNRQVAAALHISFRQVRSVRRHEYRKGAILPSRTRAPNGKRSPPRDTIGASYKADLVEAAKVARCRCGLSLPCNDCLAPNAVEHMQTRMRRAA